MIHDEEMGMLKEEDDEEHKHSVDDTIRRTMECVAPTSQSTSQEIIDRITLRIAAGAAMIRELELRIQMILQHVGDKGVCKGCGRDIWWVKHKNGKAVPYTWEGLNHFIDCPKANEFKKKEKT
jgi:hypothetical protein